MRQDRQAEYEQHADRRLGNQDERELVAQAIPNGLETLQQFDREVADLRWAGRPAVDLPRREKGDRLRGRGELPIETKLVQEANDETQPPGFSVRILCAVEAKREGELDGGALGTRGPRIAPPTALAFRSTSPSACSTKPLAKADPPSRSPDHLPLGQDPTGRQRTASSAAESLGTEKFHRYPRP